jgi:hypothetical protein
VRRRRHDRRAFRIWLSCGRCTTHAPAADRAAIAVDQARQFVIVVHIGIEIALLLHHDLDAAGGQANEIEAETGVERIANASSRSRNSRSIDLQPWCTGMSGIDGKSRAPRRRCGRKFAAAAARPCPAGPSPRPHRGQPGTSVAAITASVATGSGKRFSHECKSGSGFRGLIGASPCPSACSSRP